MMKSELQPQGKRVIFITRLSSSLPCSQVNDRRAKGSGFSDAAAAVSNHAACVADQLDELLKGNVLYCSEIGVLLNALLPHHPHHLLTPCSQHSSQNTHIFI